jgi:hypothetical protein
MAYRKQWLTCGSAKETTCLPLASQLKICPDATLNNTRNVSQNLFMSGFYAISANPCDRESVCVCVFVCVSHSCTMPILFEISIKVLGKITVMAFLFYAAVYAATIASEFVRTNTVTYTLAFSGENM